jgi:hypothetical protein
VICTPPEARGYILRDCNHLCRAAPHRETEANKGSICRYNMFDFLLDASPLRARVRDPHPSAWKENPPNFVMTAFSEVHSESALVAKIALSIGASLVAAFSWAYVSGLCE